MTPEQFEAFMEVLASIDRRMRSMEADSADSMAAIDEMSKNMLKLQEVYVSLDQKVDDNNAIVSNYVSETQGLRVETRNLHSEVRKKLAVGGA